MEGRGRLRRVEKRREVVIRRYMKKNFGGGEQGKFYSSRAFGGGTNDEEGHTTVAFVTGTVSAVRNPLVSHHYAPGRSQLADIFRDSSLHLSTRIVEKHTHTPLTFVTKRLASHEHTPPSRV